MRAVVSVLIVAALACGKKDDGAAPPAKATRPPVIAADGTRHVAITASKDGYTPDRVVGKPAEKLVLEFTRTEPSSCLERVVMPDKTETTLPLNKVVAIAVTVPKTGEVTFACGMDMFRGVIVAEP